MKTRIFLYVYLLCAGATAIAFTSLCHSAPWARGHIMLNFTAALLLFTAVNGTVFPSRFQLRGPHRTLLLGIFLLLCAAAALYCGWIAYMVTAQTPLCAALFGVVQLSLNLRLFTRFQAK